MNKKAILQYLNIYKDIDEKTDLLIDECIKEVIEKSHFKVTYKKFSLSHQPLQIKELDLLLNSKDLDFYFENCFECLVIACTLGIEIDRYIKYLEHLDMAKAVVFDAVSSRYLEECCDEYEKSLHLPIHTFRFAPGYGDLALNLNINLSQVLQIHKAIGVSINDGGLFIPMKSMLGIIGIGDKHSKSCLSCIRKESCVLRKGNQRCYVID
ncbi:MAG: ABC transporter substrate-binding protein [Coprobacillus sp.]